MKDCRGREIAVGDRIAHVDRHGSYVHIGVGTVFEVAPTTVRWVEDDATRTRWRKRNYHTCQTPALVVAWEED